MTHFLRPSHQRHCHVRFWAGLAISGHGRSSSVMREKRRPFVRQCSLPCSGDHRYLMMIPIHSSPDWIWASTTINSHYGFPGGFSVNRFVALVNLPWAQQFGSSIQRRQLLQVVRVARIIDVKAWPIVVSWRIGVWVFEFDSIRV